MKGLLKAAVGVPAEECGVRDVPPDTLAEEAERRGLCGHVWKGLETFRAPAEWKERAGEALLPAVRRHWARALKVLEDASDVLEALRDRGVKAVPFKGVFLSERLYGDPLRRRAGDVDVVLPEGPEAVPPALEALERLGYRFPFASGVMRDFYLRWYGQVPLVGEGRCPVDLHYAPGGDFPKDAFRSVFGGGREPGDGDLFLLLAGHLWTQKPGDRLPWLADLAAVVRGGKAFSAGWKERAAEWRMWFLSAAALAALEGELGMTPPREAWEEAAGRLDERGLEVCRRLREGRGGGVPREEVLGLHRLGLPWRERARAVWRFLWPHPGRILREEGADGPRPGPGRRLAFALERFRRAAGLGRR